MGAAVDGAGAAGGLAVGPAGGENPVTETPLTPKNYHALKYLNPFKFWLPFPLIRVNEAAGENKNARFTDIISLDGGGIFSYMADPAQMNQITMNAAFDARSLMGLFDIQWTNNYFGLPLTFTFKDDINRPDNARTAAQRRTDFGLSAQLTNSVGNGPASFSLTPGLGVSLRAPDRGAGRSPYTWKYDDPRYVFSLGLGLSSLTRYPWELFGSGVSLAVHGRYAMPDEMPLTYRFEGVFQAAFEPYLPLRLRLYGIRDENGMNLAGLSGLYADSPAGDLAPAEYNSIAYSLKWLAGGEAEAKLFSLEIQRNLSHVYFNRFFGTLAYRGGFYDSKDLEGPAPGQLLRDSYRLTQSLVLRLGLTFSAAIIPASPMKFTFSTKGILKISNMFDGDPANDFAIGIYFDGPGS
jgi:hypothetical protein